MQEYALQHCNMWLYSSHMYGIQLCTQLSHNIRIPGMCSNWAAPCAECTIWLCNICRAVSCSTTAKLWFVAADVLSGPAGKAARNHTI
jgi:hypothetical protein